MIPQLLLGATFSWTLYAAISLYSNIRRARTLEVPLIIVPVSPMNILWIVFEPLIFRILDLLPFLRSESFNHYARRGWHFKDKSSSHIKLGDAFAIVTPRETFLHICEPDAINEIFGRRQDFVRPVELYKMLDVFGPSVSTVGWADWQRQRKIVAAPFNENMNKLVWTESLSQTRDMVQAWSQHGTSGIVGLAKDTRTLALDVLAATGFRKSYQFRTSMEPGPDEARNYRHALAMTMDNSLLMMLVPPRILNLPILPESLKKVGRATNDFKQYMMDMLTEERRLLDSGKPGTGNLMTGLVRASEDEQNKTSGQKRGDTDTVRKGLSVSEILGNIFVINFAGHDTTANTLSYAILLLAAYPEVQEWVGEEIQEILGDSNSETWNYESLFPRLKRCFAVLLETLRLYPPIMALPKYTSKSSTTLALGEKLMTIPSNTMVVPSLLSIHTHPRYWPFPLEYHPFRWISLPPNTTPSDMPLSTRLELEQLFEPRKGTYFPWSDGPQYCPGKKFAQVEFVAVLACLLQSHRVRLGDKGEDKEDARKRILACCEDSELTLLLRMRSADDVRLVLEKVDSS